MNIFINPTNFTPVFTGTWANYITGTQRRARVVVYMPPQPAISAIPAVAPTLTQVRFVLNSGWNSVARSVSMVTTGEFLEYTISAGCHGSLICLGRRNMERDSIGMFYSGILIDASGVWAFERGVKKSRLRIACTGNSLVRIGRQADKSICYTIITDKETLIYKSDVVQSGDLYAYAFLYSSGDAVNSSELTTGEVQFGSA